MICDVCGNEKETIQKQFPLWEYGKRIVRERNICKECIRDNE